MIEILEDDSLAAEDGPGDGHAPIHAVTLLRDLIAIEAIGPMLKVLARCDSMDILYSALINALHQLGPPVLEPALAAYQAAELDDQRRAVLDVLAGIRARDERVYALLLEALERDAELVAGLMAEYGDAPAISRLSECLDAHALDLNHGPFANQVVIELAAAIEDLGGTLTVDQARKIAAERSAREALTAPALRILRAMAARHDVDPDAAEASRDEIVRRFEESPHGRQFPDSGWASLALRYGQEFEDVSILGFNEDVLREVLFNIFPRKVSCDPSSAREIVHELRAFWTFAKEELGHPGAEECLAELGDDVIPELEGELADPSNYGMAKSFFMAGRSRGFAVETEEGLRQWTEVYNSGLARPEASMRPAAPDRSEEKRKKRLRKLKKQAKRRNRN